MNSFGIPVDLLAVTAPEGGAPTPVPQASKRDLSLDCIHLGSKISDRDEQGNIRGCRGCGLFACAKHGTCCLVYVRKDAQGCCRTCADYDPE